MTITKSLNVTFSKGTLYLNVVVVGRPLATKLASVLMNPGHGTTVAGLGPHTADPQSALCFTYGGHKDMGSGIHLAETVAYLFLQGNKCRHDMQQAFSTHSQCNTEPPLSSVALGKSRHEIV